MAVFAEIKQTTSQLYRECIMAESHLRSRPLADSSFPFISTSLKGVAALNMHKTKSRPSYLAFTCEAVNDTPVWLQ